MPKKDMKYDRLRMVVWVIIILVVGIIVAVRWYTKGAIVGPPGSTPRPVTETAKQEVLQRLVSEEQNKLSAAQKEAILNKMKVKNNLTVEQKQQILDAIK